MGGGFLMPIYIPPVTVDTSDGVGTPGALIHDGQLSLGNITLGQTDAYGVEWILESLTGWTDLPPSTGGSEQRAGSHGAWVDQAYYAPRVLELTGTVLARSWDGVEAAMDRLMTSVPLSEPDWLTVATNRRTLQARVRQEGDPLTTMVDGFGRFSLSLLAPDPRRYSSGLVSVTTSLPSTTGGLSLPLTLPLTVGATVVAGVLRVENVGNMSTPPTLTISGPCPAGTVTHLETGRSFRWHSAIPAGRYLRIDADRRTALLDGTSPQLLTGVGFEYAPGTNSVAFTADSYDPDARLTSQHRSAWR